MREGGGREGKEFEASSTVALINIVVILKREIALDQLKLSYSPLTTMSSLLITDIKNSFDHYKISFF